MKELKEKPINWDTYRFVKRRRQSNKNKRIEVVFTLGIPMFERLCNLSKRKGISMTEALEMLVGTAEAEAIEPTPEINWRTYWKKKESPGIYMLTNLLELGKNKTKR